MEHARPMVGAPDTVIPSASIRCVAVYASLSFAKTSSHSVDDGRCSRDRPRKAGKASTICWAVQWAVGCSVTLKWTTRRRWWASTTRTKRTRSRSGGHGEEIDRNQVPDVIGQKRPPGLRGRAAPLREQPRDGAFGHIDAELQELTMDSRGAPERVRGGQACNEGLDLGGDGRATPDRPGGEPGPVRAEAAPLPSQDGVGSHDHEGLSP